MRAEISQVGSITTLILHIQCEKHFRTVVWLAQLGEHWDAMQEVMGLSTISDQHKGLVISAVETAEGHIS